MAAEPRAATSPVIARVRLVATAAAVLALCGWLVDYIPVHLEVAAGVESGALAMVSAPAATVGGSRPYIVVDRRNNMLWLRRGQEVILAAVVSTGSGATLREAGGDGRAWLFETPAGRFRILGVRHRPTWIKPDWAFVEEGQPIPSRSRDRNDPHALGEYALDLGDGYLIHGTLYERLLGRSVTHGCIRVGRDDLRRLVEQVGPGTQVFIF